MLSLPEKMHTVSRLAEIWQQDLWRGHSRERLYDHAICRAVGFHSSWLQNICDTWLLNIFAGVDDGCIASLASEQSCYVGHISAVKDIYQLPPDPYRAVSAT